jgi:L-threonylcarbamoyladenylate synthase
MRVIRCAGRDALTPGEASAVAATVRDGGVILFPTDTLYGLGAGPLSADGLVAVFRIKGRQAGKPLPVLIADVSLLERFAAEIPEAWNELIQRFWPGPLTLLFPALAGLPPGIVSASGKIALRVPGSALCRSVLAAAGGSLTGTSANPAGGGGTGDPREAVGKLGRGLALLVNAGTLPSSRESTLVDMAASGAVTVLRPGAIATAAVEEALGSRRTARPPVDKPVDRGV